VKSPLAGQAQYQHGRFARFTRLVAFLGIFLPSIRRLKGRFDECVKATMKTVNFVVSAFLALSSSAQAVAQRCEVDSGFRGGYFRIGYEQRELVKLFRSLDEIPEEVRNRLNEYLREKLGDTFAHKLRFEEGQWLDLKNLRKQFPSVYEENAKLGSYDLLFSFSDPYKGLKAFFTKMALNDDGSVNREIGLPDIASNPAKADIISCRDAYSIATSNGFPTEFSSARFEYSEEKKVFVWIITDSRETEPDDPLMPRFKGTYKRIEIDANTGTVVRIYKETIVI